MTVHFYPEYKEKNIIKNYFEFEIRTREKIINYVESKLSIGNKNCNINIVYNQNLNVVNAEITGYDKLTNIEDITIPLNQILQEL